ncbi:MAG: serine/threonine protein kinase [Proteobacteria bacterium]|nr:serine/threonine protein kinase [Pseudomonadota bacterium]
MDEFLQLREGETILKEARDSHFVRPGDSSIARLCRVYLTSSRLIVLEARYDIAAMKELGPGALLHEVALKDIENVSAAPASIDPAVELEVNGFEGRRERLYVCLRDGGWHLGEPERRDERDHWVKAIGQILAKRGVKAAPRPAAAKAAPPPPATPAGTLVGGKYAIERQIGEGGMGHVFLAKDRTLGRMVALKKMRDELLSMPKEIEGFMSEARISASLHHPFIAAIHEILQNNEGIFLVFEYLDGASMEEAISDKGRLRAPELRKILRCVCGALTHAHAEGVIHRDLKPSNIMLTKDGFAKVTDFGVARRMKEITSRSAKTSHPDNTGTLAYMAPEQELGRFSPVSDVFALGATVFEALTGEMPFPGPNFYLQKQKMDFPRLADEVPDAPPELVRAVERCLRFDPAERFASVAEFAAAAGVGEGA